MYKCRQKYSQTVYGCTSACLGCPDVLVVEEAGGDVVVEVGPPVNTTHWHLSPHWPPPSPRHYFDQTYSMHPALDWFDRYHSHMNVVAFKFQSLH